MPDVLPLPTGDDLAELLQQVVADTFEAENTRRQEDRDPTKLTLSGLGGCTRRNAYAVAGTPPTDQPEPEQARAALLGVGVHDWFLPAFARALGRRLGLVCDVEKRVVLNAAGIAIVGHLDAVFAGVVLDLKTVGEHRLHGVRRTGSPYSEHRLQVVGYGLAEYQTGRAVTQIAYLYLDRTTGDVYPIAEPFNDAAGLAVIDRVETITRFAENPDQAPREARGPGLSAACDRCPWLRRCWGPTAQPGATGPQTQLAATPDGLIEILRLYYHAAQAAGQASRDKEFAKLVLSRTNPDVYGEYKLSRGRDSDMDDETATKEIITALGLEIPTKRRAGATTVKLAPLPTKGR